jgi:uncharacterized membrane protein YfcA
MLTFSAPVRRSLERTHWKMGAAGAAALQIALGVYGGYFGGAVGLISMAAWVLITDASAKDLAPARTLFLMAANAAACVLFVALDLISWAHVLPVAVGAVTGGYLGARVGMKLPAHMVRWAVLSITYVTTAVFFWRTYAG